MALSYTWQWMRSCDSRSGAKKAACHILATVIDTHLSLRLRQYRGERGARSPQLIHGAGSIASPSGRKCERVRCNAKLAVTRSVGERNARLREPQGSRMMTVGVLVMEWAEQQREQGVDVA